MRGDNALKTPRELIAVMILYNEQMVAVVTPAAVHFFPDIEGLGDEHPTRRFVSVMCLYAGQVHEGATEEPYSHERAELFARAALIGNDELRAAEQAGLDDVQLAERFGVPPEQISRAREDLAAAQQRQSA